MVVFGKKWLYSDKSCCIKVVVFGVRAKIVGQSIRAKSGKSGRIRAKWLYSDKNGCIQAKVVVFG